MNKQLYIENENKQKELRELNIIIHDIQNFLQKYEDNFKKEDSIKAIIKIKAYLELKNKEKAEKEKIQTETYRNLYNTCSHEVSVKYSNIPDYRCLICNCALTRENIEVPKQSLISIDTTNDYKVAYLIEDKFKEIINSDKDLVETIAEFLEEIQYERNIKVLRRTK